VTTFAKGVNSVDFSPDESRLLLQISATDLAEPAKAPVVGAAGGQAPARKPWVVTRMQMKEDAGEGYLTGDRAEHLCVLDLATGKLRQLTAGAFDESEASWSPDGRQLVFVSNREADPDASYKTDLWLVAADTTDQGKTLQRLTNDDRVKGAPAFSPDGKTIAFLVADDGVYGSPQVAVLPAAGGEARVLTAPLDRWVNQFRFSADGQWIYFAYENLGGTQLARVRASDGRIEPVAEGEQSIGGFDLGKDGVHRRARRGGKPRRGSLCDREAPLDAAHERQRGVHRLGRAREQGVGVLQESRWHRSPGLRDEAAGLRRRPPLSDDPAHPRRTRRAVRLGLRLQAAVLRDEGLRRRRAEPARIHGAAARTSCARSTRPGASPTTTT
jgi:hypothetical protein